MKLTHHDEQATAVAVPGGESRPSEPVHRTTPPLWPKARRLKDAGRYKAARRILYKWWPRESTWPRTDGLDSYEAAELLLLTGAIKGGLGSTGRPPGEDVGAIELLTEAALRFEQMGELAKAGETRSEMAWCLDREGKSEEARPLLQRALKEIGDGGGAAETMALALLRAAIFADHSGHLAEADARLRECESLLKTCDNPALLGAFHNSRAIQLSKFGEEPGREDFLERALMEYVAAIIYFEEIKALRRQAAAENNLGLMLVLLGRFDESARRLDHAHALYTRLRDASRAADVTESKARRHLAQGNNKEAEKLAEKAAGVFELEGRLDALAEARTTSGVAKARTGRLTEARKTLERALELAEQVGAWEKAALAALAVLEESGEQLSVVKILELFELVCSYSEGARPARMQARLISALRTAFKAALARDSVAAVHAPHAHDAAGASDLKAAARRLSGDNASSLIGGANTGARRLLASYVHESSGRGGPFVAIDCRSFEGESYAPERFAQIVLAANGGTLFFDNVKGLSHDYQQRLLLLVRDGVVEQDGAEQMRTSVDVRVLAGSSHDLSEEAADGLFSTELYERLCGPGSQPAPSAEAFNEERMVTGCMVKAAVEHRYAAVAQRPPEVEKVLRAHAADAADVLAEQLAFACSAAPSQVGSFGGLGGATAAASACFAAFAEDDDNKGRVPFNELVDRFELELICGTLRLVGKSVTKAAVVLDMKRTTLANMIETKKEKHPELEQERTPVFKRPHRPKRARPARRRRGSPK